MGNEVTSGRHAKVFPLRRLIDNTENAFRTNVATKGGNEFSECFSRILSCRSILWLAARL